MHLTLHLLRTIISSILLIFPILGTPIVFHGVVESIIRKSEAFKIDLYTQDNFGKTAIGYFKAEYQKELKEYAFKKNIGVLLTGGLWSFELEELQFELKELRSIMQFREMMEEEGN